MDNKSFKKNNKAFLENIPFELNFKLHANIDKYFSFSYSFIPDVYSLVFTDIFTSFFSDKRFF